MGVDMTGWHRLAEAVRRTQEQAPPTEALRKFADAARKMQEQAPPRMPDLAATVRTARHLIGSDDEDARAEHRANVERLAAEIERGRMAR